MWGGRFGLLGIHGRVSATLPIRVTLISTLWSGFAFGFGFGGGGTAASRSVSVLGVEVGHVPLSLAFELVAQLPQLVASPSHQDEVEASPREVRGHGAP